MDELAFLPLMASKIRLRDSRAKSDDARNEEMEEDDEAGYSSDEDGDSAEFHNFFP